MINPPKIPEPSITPTVQKQQSDTDNLSKKRKPPEDVQVFERSYNNRKRNNDETIQSGARISDALLIPKKKDKPFERFLISAEKNDTDIASGRSFQALLNIQALKSRPLIIARCSCSDHAQTLSSNRKFSHPEFMDGYVAYEFLENIMPSKSSLTSKTVDNAELLQREKAIKNFIKKEFEFWAVHPSGTSFVAFSTKTASLTPASGPSPAVEALLMCEPKLMAEEGETEHAFAYLVAGLYHCGHLVQKDQVLASNSVALIKAAKSPYSQASALKWSIDIGIDVFASLLKMGLDPEDTDEFGWSTIDIVNSKLTGATQKLALDALSEGGNIEK